MHGRKPMFNKPVATVIMALWAVGAAGVVAAVAQTTTSASSVAASAVAPVAKACQRFAAGSVIQQPPALFSQNGVLNVQFSYQTTTDSVGRQLFCYMTPSGLENPTLYVNPGDTLNITITNNTPAGMNPMAMNGPNCGASTMDTSSVNIHFHGTNISPVCGQDEVIKTIVNS